MKWASHLGTSAPKDLDDDLFHVYIFTLEPLSDDEATLKARRRLRTRDHLLSVRRVEGACH